MLVGPVILYGAGTAAICSDCVMAACDQIVDAARRLAPKGRAIMFSDSISVPGLPDHLNSILGSAARGMTMAQEKYPAPNYTLLKVAEESGELVKAAIHYAEGRDTWENVENEAVQAIAMILRLLDEGDGRNGVFPPRREG